MSSGRQAYDECSGLVCHGALSDRPALLGADAKRYRPPDGVPQATGTDHTPDRSRTAAPSVLSGGISVLYRYRSSAVYSEVLCRIRGGKTAPETAAGTMRVEPGMDMSEVLKLDV